MEGTVSVSTVPRCLYERMNAKQILTTMQTLASFEALEAKVKDSEDMVRSLIQQVDMLTKVNRRQQESLDHLFTKMQCPSCTHYLESKGEGDTIEGRKCDKVVLTRCLGIAQ